MNTVSTTASLLAASLLSVILLAGCDLTGKGSPNNGQGGSGSVRNPGGSASPTTANGTSDSGGGTGIDGKIYESYIVDPTTLPAYQKVVRPLFDNIKADLQTDSQPARDDGRNNDSQSHFDDIFKMKTWYIAPVELEKISKDVLGVSFINSNTEQIARQTTKEVWIDKRVFDAMDLQSQGELILHEYIMNVYFFKFISMTKMCVNLDRTASPKKRADCLAAAKALDLAMPPEAPRPLNEQDNLNIRFVTGWLMLNAKKPIQSIQFTKIAAEHGFDPRFFNPAISDRQPDHGNIKISGRELYRAVQGAAFTGKMPNLCIGQTSKVQKPCKIEMSEIMIPVQSLSLAGYKIKITIDGELPIESSFFGGAELNLFPMDQINGSPIYAFGFADWRNHIGIGDRLYSGALLFRQDNLLSDSIMTFDSIVIQPGIVTSVDALRDPICYTSSPKVSQLRDDVMVMKLGSAVSIEAQTILAASPAFALCTKDNVQD